MRHRNGTSFRSRGFTLIELQLSLCLLLVGVVALSGAVMTAMRHQTTSRNRHQISRALASQMEVIGQTPFNLLYSTYNNLKFSTHDLDPSLYSAQGGNSKTTASALTKPDAVLGTVKVTVLDPRLVSVTLSATLEDEEPIQLYQEFGQ